MTIERNLGNVERLSRLALGLWLLWLALSNPGLNGIDWFIGILSIALILNGVFSRCYLWYILDINTASTGGDDCERDAYTNPGADGAWSSCSAKLNSMPHTPRSGPPQTTDTGQL